MVNKYKLTNEYKTFRDIKLFKIEATGFMEVARK